MADSQSTEPSFADGIKAGLFGISGYSGRSAAKIPILRTETRERVTTAELGPMVKNFEAAGAKVSITSDDSETFKVVATWDK